MKKRLVPLLLGGAVVALVVWSVLAYSPPKMPRLAMRAVTPVLQQAEGEARFFEQFQIIRTYIHQVNPRLSEEESSTITRLLMYSAQKYEVDPLLVASLAAIESRFDPRAVSERGAMGIMQLMPETAQDLGVRNPFDLKENIDAGVRYFGYLLRRYRNNTSWLWPPIMLVLPALRPKSPSTRRP